MEWKLCRIAYFMLQLIVMPTIVEHQLFLWGRFRLIYRRTARQGELHTMTWCDLKGMCCNVCFRNPLNAILRALGGGGGGGGGMAPALRISRKMGVFFRTSACPRFCKRRVLFCTQVRSIRGENPLQSMKYPRLWRRVTPELTGLPSCRYCYR